jgi:hypothetical protein
MAYPGVGWCPNMPCSCGIIVKRCLEPVGLSRVMLGSVGVKIGVALGKTDAGVSPFA